MRLFLRAKRSIPGVPQVMDMVRECHLSLSMLYCPPACFDAPGQILAAILPLLRPLHLPRFRFFRHHLLQQRRNSPRYKSIDFCPLPCQLKKAHWGNKPLRSTSLPDPRPHDIPGCVSRSLNYLPAHQPRPAGLQGSIHADVIYTFCANCPRSSLVS